jgi:multiple sugar transport system ATP-binding protein
MAAMRFINVSKVYSDGTIAVRDLNLEIADGEFMVFVGPSGCGKTTALRMVAGLEEVTDGEIAIGDQVINELEPRKRDVAMVFQNYALYPHMTIFENIAFPLRSRRMPKSEINARVTSTAAMLGLEQELKRRPRMLSGGQRQRVAMGRAIVRQPQVFLMDEPLSNLDAKLRVQMRAEIAKLQRELQVTTIYVTHDQVEALTMGTRIAVMRKGVLQQAGPPQEIYDYPRNVFVASFIGSPPMNLFAGETRTTPDGPTLIVGSSHVRLPTDWPKGADSSASRPVAVGVRPERMYVRSAPSPDQLAITGIFQLLETLGSDRLVHVETQLPPVVSDALVEIAADTDASAVTTLELEATAHRHVVVARLPEAPPQRLGETLTLAAHLDHIHLFDLETGEALRD